MNARSSFGATFLKVDILFSGLFIFVVLIIMPTARLSTWTSAKNYKKIMVIKEQNSSHQVELHFEQYSEFYISTYVGINWR